MRILLVEDERSLARSLALALRHDGHTVDVAWTGVEGDLLAATHYYDAIVLQVELPDTNALVLIRRWRRVGMQAPILALSGPSDVTTGIRALDAGADEYLLESTERTVVVACVRALGRRRRNLGAGDLIVGNVHLDPIAHTVTVGHSRLALPLREFRLLDFLLARPDEIVTRSQLLEGVWDTHVDPRSNLVDALVSRLRIRLAKAGASVTIDGVRRMGFVLRERLAQGDAAAPGAAVDASA
jgi:DNA-binding response OmpR family regulator